MLLICLIDQETDQFKSYKNVAVEPTSVEFEANLKDRFGFVKLTQYFDIDTDADSAKYKFPLDYNSALSAMIVTNLTSGEVIEGVVKEKSEAKRDYETGKREGKQVFMASESEFDRDIQILDIGNLRKGDSLRIEYQYVTELSFNASQGVFYIPTFISPRYGGESIPRPNNTIECLIKIAGSITNLEIDTPGMRLSATPSHTEIRYTCTGIISKDIEIKYNIKQSVGAFMFDVAGHHLAMIQFKANIKYDRDIRELVFVLDCSGSMFNRHSQRIHSATKAIVQCLNMMRGKNYRFNIIKYGDNYQVFRGSYISIAKAMSLIGAESFTGDALHDSTKEVIAEAIAFCNVKQDLGGTQTGKALRKALELAKHAILITDGDTSNNRELREICSKFVQLNILGIGNGINRANLNDIAVAGHGMALFNQDDTDVTSNVVVLFQSIGKPAITNLKTNLLEFGVEDRTPTFDLVNVDGVLSASIQKSDKLINLVTKYPLVPDQYYTMYAILDGFNEFTKFTLMGSSLDANLNIELPFSELSGVDDLSTRDALGRIIAKRVIQQNEDLDKSQLIKIACNFQIVTRFTALVAVGRQIVTPIKSTSHLYAQGESLRRVDDSMHDAFTKNIEQVLNRGELLANLEEQCEVIDEIVPQSARYYKSASLFSSASRNVKLGPSSSRNAQFVPASKSSGSLFSGMAAAASAAVNSMINFKSSAMPASAEVYIAPNEREDVYNQIVKNFNVLTGLCFKTILKIFPSINADLDEKQITLEVAKLIKNRNTLKRYVDLLRRYQHLNGFSDQILDKMLI